MHLADAFIQSDLHCIQVTVLHFISSWQLWITLLIITGVDKIVHESCGLLFSCVGHQNWLTWLWLILSLLS